MSISALVPIAHLLAANAALEAAGHGPENFSVPAYAGTGATHAALHCWDSPEFLSALQAIPQVTILSGLVNGIDLDSIARTEKIIEDAGAQWGSESPALPNSGTVTAGMLYQFDEALWYVIQSFSRSTYNAHPNTYPALIRRVRNPQAVESWQQPIDQYDAYKALNPFTGQPDQATHNGETWYVTGVDGSGNNVWEPGVFGWTIVGQEPGPSETWVDTGATITSQAGQLFYVSLPIDGLGLTAGQAIRIGPTLETTFVQVWPGTTMLMQINPYVAATAGMKVWKWA